MSKHLWEVDHSYYMTTGNYFSRDCHTEWQTWQEFTGEFLGSDLDMNYLVRWDWLEGDDWGAGTYNGDDYYRHAHLMLQFVGQRKALLSSHRVMVCRADEPSVIEFLNPRWKYIADLWAPFRLAAGQP